MGRLIVSFALLALLALGCSADTSLREDLFFSCDRSQGEDGQCPAGLECFNPFIDATNGVCTTDCDSSEQCPEDFECIDEHCLPSCEENSDCGLGGLPSGNTTFGCHSALPTSTGMPPPPVGVCYDYGPTPAIMQPDRFGSCGVAGGCASPSLCATTTLSPDVGNCTVECDATTGPDASEIRECPEGMECIPFLGMTSSCLIPCNPGMGCPMMGLDCVSITIPVGPSMEAQSFCLPPALDGGTAPFMREVMGMMGMMP